MKTVSVTANQVSQPEYVPSGSRITMAGSGYIEWTPASTLQDARQTSAVWDRWPNGTTAGYQDVLRGMAIRVVGTGNCTVTIEEGKADNLPSGQYWDSQTVTAQTDPLTGVLGISVPGASAPLKNSLLQGINVAVLGDSLTRMNNGYNQPTAVVRSNNVCTVTKSAHGLGDKQRVRVYGLTPADMNTEAVEITYIDANSFSYPSVGADGSATISGVYSGYVALSWYSNTSPFMFANGIVGGNLKLVANFGQTAETTDQILARVPASLAAAPTATDWWVLGGTNDVVGSATTAQIKANLKAIYAALLSAGKRVVALTIPPLGSGHAAFATATPKIIQINNWIKQYASGVVGITVADVHGKVVDPASATGAPRANALQSDNIHWQTYGGYLAGTAIAETYSSIVPNMPILATSPANYYTQDAGNSDIWCGMPSAATGGVISDVVSGVAGDGFNVASAGNAGRTAVASVPARSDGYGYDQQVVFTAAASGDTVTIQQESAASIATRVVAGETYVLRFNISITGVVGSGLSYFRNRLQGIFGGIQQGLGSASQSLVTGLNSVGADLTNLVVETPPFKIPAGACTSISSEWILGFAAAGTAITMKIGRVSLERVNTSA